MSKEKRAREIIELLNKKPFRKLSVAEYYALDCALENCNSVFDIDKNHNYTWKPQL